MVHNSIQIAQQYSWIMAFLLNQRLFENILSGNVLRQKKHLNKTKTKLEKIRSSFEEKDVNRNTWVAIYSKKRISPSLKKQESHEEKQDPWRIHRRIRRQRRERQTPRKSTKPQSNLLDWQLEFKKCAELDFRRLQFARFLTISLHACGFCGEKSSIFNRERQRRCGQ